MGVFSLNEKGHSGHHLYQIGELNKLSDNDIVVGVIKGYGRDACDSKHHEVWADHLPTDECRYFEYPNGGCDHYNMRWFGEWCQANRPHILERLYALKVFW